MMIFWSRITTPFYGIKLSFVRSSLLESGYTNINSGSDWNLQPRTPNQFNQCRFQQQTRTSQKLKSRRESHPHPTKAKGIGVGQDGLERRQTSILLGVIVSNPPHSSFHARLRHGAVHCLLTVYHASIVSPHSESKYSAPHISS